MQDFSSAFLGTSGKDHQGQQVFKTKKMRVGWEGKEEKQGQWNCSIVSVERARHESVNESLSHSSAGTNSTQSGSKCSIGFLSRQFGDSDTKFWGRQTSTLKPPVWTLPKACSEHIQTFCHSVYYWSKAQPYWYAAVPELACLHATSSASPHVWQSQLGTENRPYFFYYFFFKPRLKLFMRLPQQMWVLPVPHWQQCYY